MIEVLFSPAEFEALPRRDLSETVCAVFDVLRATSSLVTALAHGAAGIIPVSTIDEALAIKMERPDVLLAGERDGLRISAKLTGSVEFDFGNSPREFRSEAARGRTLVMTTTNGTRALQACRGAREILPSAFLNLDSVADHIRKAAPKNLLLVCSGTYEEASYEDLLGAGALADALWEMFAAGHAADSAEIARNIYRQHANDLEEAMRHARNGRRLLAMEELREDVPFSLQRNLYNIVARLGPDGAARSV